MKNLITKYYLYLASLPIVGGVLHAVVHTTTHLFGIGGCPQEASMALNNALCKAEKICNRTGERQYVIRTNEGYLIIAASDFTSDLNRVVVYCIDQIREKALEDFSVLSFYMWFSQKSYGLVASRINQRKDTLCIRAANF